MQPLDKGDFFCSSIQSLGEGAPGEEVGRCGGLRSPRSQELGERSRGREGALTGFMAGRTGLPAAQSPPAPSHG